MSNEKIEGRESKVYLAGAFVCLLGVMVIVGWYTSNPLFIQILPTLTPMQFNTALCLSLTGLGILAACRFPNVSGLLGLLVLMIGGLTLSEYIFSIKLGIDELLMSARPFSNVAIPGRPAPNTAFCLVLLGVMLVLRFNFLHFRYKGIVTASLGIFVLTLTSVAIIGYVFGIGVASRWGGWTQMALHTAIGLLVSGGALFYLDWEEFKKDEYAKRTILPVTIVGLGLSLFLILWQVLVYNETNKIHAIIDSKVSVLIAGFNTKLAVYHASLSRMAKRQSADPAPSISSWQEDARNYLNDFGAIEALALYQPDKNSYVVVSKTSMGSAALRQCRASLDAEYKIGSLFLQHETSSLCIPLMIKNKNRTNAYIISIISLRTLIEELMQEASLDNYGLRLSGENQIIYYHDNKAGILLEDWVKDTSIQYQNINLEFQVWPNKMAISELTNNIPIVSFLIGNLVTILLAITIWLLQSTKLNQVKLIESERRARAASHQLKSIMNSSYLSIIAVNLDGIITEFNHAAERMLGYKAEEMIGKNTPVVFHDIEEIKKHSLMLSKQYNISVTPGFQTFIATLPFKEVDEAEWTYIRKDGERIPVLLAVTAIKTEGVVVGYMGIALDISERKALEKMKNEFISVVSHELRTPLTSIHGSISLLVGHVMGELSKEVTDLLNIALHNTERLIRLINDILDIEKMDAGKMEFKKELFDVNQLLEEGVAANRSYGDKFSVKLSFRKSLPQTMVNVDHDRFLQVLTNLISNAIKFSKKDGEVIVSTQLLPNDMVRVKITDQGEGVSETFQKRIFSKFAQADSSMVRGHAGTGLGLSIAKTIVEKMGGTIGYKTKIHEGTTFYFDLPVITKKSIMHPLSQDQGDKKIQVLYVEDDKDLSTVVSTVLKPWCDVFVVDNAKDAKSSADQYHYDVILLDLILSDGLGIDLLPHFKIKEIPVVVFTAFDLPREFSPYAAGFLVKSKTSHEDIIREVKAAAALKTE